MACVTLKRTLPLDTLLNGNLNINNSNSVEPSSTLNLNTNSSTLAHRNGGSGPLAKRRRCAPLTYIPAPRSTSCASACATAPLATVAQAIPQLSGEALHVRLREEGRRLRRARLLMNSSATSAGDTTEEDSNISIDSSLSAACQCLNNGGSQMSLSPPPSSSSAIGNGPLFTLQQIGFIFTRLLSEREQQLRCEYERVLSEKLAEQYEAFLRFSHEQQYRNHCDNPMSYVS